MDLENPKQQNATTPRWAPNSLSFKSRIRRVITIMLMPLVPHQELDFTWG